MAEKIIKYFPIWAILFAAIAFFCDSYFASLKSAIIPLLAIVMFGMGMTLTWDNFREVIKTPKSILVGFSLQYLVMPFAAYFISAILDLSPMLMAGLVLVGCSPGGTASNVITFLAGGNVALSITLTLVSTIAAVLFTPFLTMVLLNHVVPVPALEMFLDILQIVLVPVIIGTAINSFMNNKIKSISNIFPLISALAIILIIAIIVALNKTKISEVSLLLVFAVILHNSTGIILGYYVTKLLRFDNKTCRTIAIEVGMQNSGLGVALAIKYFSATAALPGAIFSIWHNLSGSIYAGLLRMWDTKNEFQNKKI